jgi:hypothetical protein
MIAFIVLVYFVFIFFFILRISTMAWKLNSSQESKNFQNKSNSIEQDRRSSKFTTTFYRLRINKKCFVAIETCI